MLRKHPVEPLDAAQAFRKAADYCVSQEHCIGEVRMKMKQWGINNNLIDTTIDKLIDEGFIDEQRYASAFVRGKFKLFDWGKIKIANELRMKGIPSGQISAALNEIDENEYLETIKSLINKRLDPNKQPSREERSRIFNYLMGKGFETEIIMKAINAAFEAE